MRLTSLIALILQNAGKVIVFFSSCASVDFHYDLFTDAVWPNGSEKNTKKMKTQKLKGGFVKVKDGDENEDVDDEMVASDDDPEKEDEDDGTVPLPPIFEGVGVFKLHGNLTADERNGMIKDFSKPKTQAVLLASDVIARGIDFPEINYIIQYQDFGIYDSTFDLQSNNQCCIGYLKENYFALCFNAFHWSVHVA